MKQLAKAQQLGERQQPKPLETDVLLLALLLLYYRYLSVPALQATVSNHVHLCGTE